MKLILQCPEKSTPSMDQVRWYYAYLRRYAQVPATWRRNQARRNRLMKQWGK